MFSCLLIAVAQGLPGYILHSLTFIFFIGSCQPFDIPETAPPPMLPWPEVICISDISKNVPQHWLLCVLIALVVNSPFGSCAWKQHARAHFSFLASCV